MRVGVIVFPGTNCDADTYHVLDHVFQAPVEYIWHASTQLPRVDALILPGGFSYGDYLRAGAIARFSPVMTEVARFADAGGLVLGICNGFQILCEAGLLPGALLPNGCLEFRCVWTRVRVEQTDTPFTNQAAPGQVLRMPIAHGEGRYFADPATLARLAERRQIVVRYCAPDGSLDPASNPNDSLDAIAGICNERRNVFGLMPHPERCSEAELGGTDGQVIFRSLLTALSEAMTSAALKGDVTGSALEGGLTGSALQMGLTSSASRMGLTASALKGGSRDEGTEVPGISVPASLLLAFKPETSPLAFRPESVVTQRGRA